MSRAVSSGRPWHRISSAPLHWLLCLAAARFSHIFAGGGAQSIRQPGERACRAASECRGGANACAYVLHHIPLKRGMCHSCKNLNSEAVMQVDTSSVNSRPLQHVFG